MSIQTSVGPANVLHRLALGVECIDATADRVAATLVWAGRQAPVLRLPRGYDKAWPCIDLERSDTGRFRLRHQRLLPEKFVLRVDDPARRFVPRRFDVQLWSAADVDDNSGNPYVPVRSRLLRPWLLPGSAYQFSRGTTVIRGRVASNGNPVRWARIFAAAAPMQLAGYAHADDRGEFVLVISDPDQNPVQSTVDVDLYISAPDPKHPVPVDPDDRCADLLIEPIPRSSVPPLAGDLDNPVLRGQVVPGSYVPSAANPPPHFAVPMGAELIVPTDIVFEPPP